MLMNFSLLQKGELVMIRRAIDRDASRIAEISVFSKRMNYREIFHDDMVSFGEIQVYPLAKEYIEHPEILTSTYHFNEKLFCSLFQLPYSTWSKTVSQIKVLRFCILLKNP